MNLYLKHRPDSFEKMVGNRDVIQYLKSEIEKNNLPHSIMLEGPTGCGKTTIARIIAKKLNCSDNDFKEINIADLRGIDNVRDIIRNSQFLPSDGDVRIYLLDEAHKMGNDAQNALLKPLEDTKEHVYFILCTTEPQKLIPTIRGRCVRLELKPLRDREMLKLLRNVVKIEGQEVVKEVYEQIIMDSLGHPRNALNILEVVCKVKPDQQLRIAKKSAAQVSESIALCQALIKGHPWKKVSNILNGLKDKDPEQIRRHVLGYSQSVLLKGANDQAALIITEFMEPLYDVGFPGLVCYCYTVIKG